MAFTKYIWIPHPLFKMNGVLHVCIAITKALSHMMSSGDNFLRTGEPLFVFAHEIGHSLGFASHNQEMSMDT